MTKFTKQEQELLDGIVVDNTVIGAHHCEDLFNIETGSTELTVSDRVDTQSVKCDIYDNKDAELDEQYQQIHNAAMTAFESITSEIPSIEGKYRARANETAALFLNTALAAVKEKATLKQKKDQTLTHVKKIQSDEQTNATVQMTVAELIKMRKTEKGGVANNISQPNVPVVSEGEIVEEEILDEPPVRKMKKV